MASRDAAPPDPSRPQTGASRLVSRGTRGGHVVPQELPVPAPFLTLPWPMPPFTVNTIASPWPLGPIPVVAVGVLMLPTPSGPRGDERGRRPVQKTTKKTIKNDQTTTFFKNSKLIETNKDSVSLVIGPLSEKAVAAESNTKMTPGCPQSGLKVTPKWRQDVPKNQQKRLCIVCLLKWQHKNDAR